MSEDEARYLERAERAVINVLRQVMAQKTEYGQQILIHVQPRGAGLKIQLPPRFVSVEQKE